MLLSFSAWTGGVIHRSSDTPPHLWLPAVRAVSYRPRSRNGLSSERQSELETTKSLLQRLLDSLPKYDPGTASVEAPRQEERSPDALERLLKNLQVAVHPMAVREAGPNSTLVLPALPHPLIPMSARDLTFRAARPSHSSRTASSCCPADQHMRSVRMKTTLARLIPGRAWPCWTTRFEFRPVLMNHGRRSSTVVRSRRATALDRYVRPHQATYPHGSRARRRVEEGF